MKKSIHQNIFKKNLIELIELKLEIILTENIKKLRNNKI